MQTSKTFETQVVELLGDWANCLFVSPFIGNAFPNAQKCEPTMASMFRKYDPLIDATLHQQQKAHKLFQIFVWRT